MVALSWVRSIYGIIGMTAIVRNIKQYNSIVCYYLSWKIVISTLNPGKWLNFDTLVYMDVCMCVCVSVSDRLWLTGSDIYVYISTCCMFVTFAGQASSRPWSIYNSV